MVTVHTKQLQTTEIHTTSDLEPYMDVWEKLAAGAPMRSPDWLLAWWKYYGSPQDRLYILLFNEPGTGAVGLAPLYLQGKGRNAIFRLIGSGNGCTHHATLLTAPEWETRIGVEVARFLLQRKSNWHKLFFESVDTDDAALQAAMNYLAQHGCLVNKRPLPNNWSIELPDTWDRYLMMLSRSLRKRCRKLQRQFFDSGEIEIRQVSAESDLQRGLNILLKLHADRWGNSRNPEGVFSDPKFRGFHETGSRSLLGKKKLRLAWLEHDEKPIAVEYQFYDNKTLYAYQAGIDLAMDEFSPGKLSMMAAIQFAISHGCKSFDLLSGDEPYKSNWRATPSGCHDLRVWQDGIMARTEWTIRELFTMALLYLKPKMDPRLIKFIRRIFPR